MDHTPEYWHRDKGFFQQGLDTEKKKKKKRSRKEVTQSTLFKNLEKHYLQ